MKRIVQALQRRHANATLDRKRAAVITARFGVRREAAYKRNRPFHNQPKPHRTDRFRFGGPRYVRDGDLITIIPAPYGAGMATNCTCSAYRACKHKVAA